MEDARHIHLDAVGGIAGDMFAAAMLDALPALRDRVVADVAACLPPGSGFPELVEGTSGGLCVLRFGLDPLPPSPDHAAWPALDRRLRAAVLARGTAEAARAILRLLAEVEARLHAVPLEEVHFHEIGGWDSLMDVVAAGSIAAALAPATWSVSALPRGDGLVRTQHGLLPVPAPATAALLQGFAWRDDGIGGERVTPTGAAILRHLGARQDVRAEGRLLASGTGAGTRTLPGMPNILRALVLEPAAASGGREQVAVLAFEIDDMTGEEISVAAERLARAEGVLDLSVATRRGKKGRPAESFQLLVRPTAVEAVAERCFAETSTLGLRWHLAERTVLAREQASVAVDGAAVGVKRARRPGGGVTAKAESDDLGDGTLAERRRRKAEAEAG